MRKGEKPLLLVYLQFQEMPKLLVGLAESQNSLKYTHNQLLKTENLLAEA